MRPVRQAYTAAQYRGVSDGEAAWGNRYVPNAGALESKAARVIARMLVWLLIFQPVYVAMGMELEEPVLQTVPEVAQESVPAEEAAEEIPQTEISGGEIMNEDSTEATEASADDDTTFNESESDPLIQTDVDTDVDDVTGEGADESSGETDGEETTDGTIPPDGDDGETQNGGGSGGEEDDAIEDDAATTTEEVVLQGTTTEEILEEESVGASSTPESAVVAVHETESSFVFDDGDCTLVAEGEFYCVAKDIERLTEGDPRVYSKQDIEGDREIYYFDGMEEHRITNNSYDDFAPVFEEETLRIVWQAMLNDRLQVMLHELPTNTTRQVTTARENSSNPHIAGDTLVWQGWVGTNWEVMMTDVDNDGGPFEIEQLTDNAVHDMFPRAYDDVITWQREKGASWEVIVYDLRSGKETALQKDEGTKYENPRFVLLFDSKQANGDVETVGYDLDTGEMMELGTKAKQVPDEPKTPKDETKDALPREATSTVQIKPVKEDDDGGEPLV